MTEVLGRLLASEFFWGIIVGLLLTILGSYLLVKFQTNEQEKSRQRLVRDFCHDTIKNIYQIIDEMNDNYAKSQVIHNDYLNLLDVEIAVFGRNREHLVVLPAELREKVRAFINQCGLRKAEISGLLTLFTNKWNQANDMETQGHGPQSQHVRQEAAALLAKAKAVLDQLVLRGKDAPAIMSDLRQQ
jgi:hypothetical protein